MNKIIKIFKGILAGLDWLLVPHGYDTWGNLFHFKVRQVGYLFYKCKVCGCDYAASKRNKTCQNPICFIKWRLK